MKEWLEKLKPDPSAEYDSNTAALSPGASAHDRECGAGGYLCLVHHRDDTAEPANRWDVDATKLIGRIPDTPGTLLIWISAPGFPPFDWGVPIATIALLVLTRHLWHSVFMLLASMGGIVAGIPKVTINRARPPAELVKVAGENLFGVPSPSGHVAEYVAVFGFIFYLAYVLLPPKLLIFRWVILVATGIMVMFVGVSRVYMGKTGCPIAWRAMP